MLTWLNGEISMDKWDRAHIEAAGVYARLSSARKLQVGCVIVQNNRIISIGYNGTLPGADNDCETETDSGLVTRPEVIHAEMNSILKLAASTESGSGATAYITHAPCLDCSKHMIQAGIARVVYAEAYRDPAGTDLLVKHGVTVEQL